jgi:hypothetical protein
MMMMMRIMRIMRIMHIVIKKTKKRIKKRNERGEQHNNNKAADHHIRYIPYRTDKTQLIIQKQKSKYSSDYSIFTVARY